MAICYFPSWNTSRRHRVFAALAALLTALIAILGSTGHAQPIRPPTKLPPIKVRPRGAQSFVVRGYITAAAAPGAPPRPTLTMVAAPGKGSANSRDIYLPGVTVYLKLVATKGVRPVITTQVKTDLSGRFTLYAPAAGEYYVCWVSTVFGSGCNSRAISLTRQAQFISAVRIPLAARPGFVSVLGHVTTADGVVPRTFDPMLNINSFATVSLTDGAGNNLAQVYVNNDGDYLMPYVPTRQTVNLTAAIEAATFSQEIRPEARIEAAAFSVVNLKVPNHRPVLDPLTAEDTSGRPVQNAAPGSEVELQASARDVDGDPLNYAWFLGEGQGTMLGSSGSGMRWQLPNVPGRFTAEVVAYDNKGGYDRAVVSVLTGATGIPFTGIVVTPAGVPVPGASVEIVGNPPVTTGAEGRFDTNVAQSNRYVLNIRKQGFALNSRVYDQAVTGGRWILTPDQVETIDPTTDVSITHKRGDDSCPGPESQRASLGVAGESLTAPQWQDGKGGVTDPPAWWQGPGSAAQIGSFSEDQFTNGDGKGKTDRPLVFVGRDLKLPPCGPGITVTIPANSILDASGNPATTPLQVGISTVDLLSPQQFPGDDTVVPLAGGGAYIQSYGAGGLDLPAGYKLKAGAKATISIPVDRSSHPAAGPLPPAVPLLSYDEQRGLWKEEGVMTLSTVSGVPAYTAPVSHFTTYNADTFFGSGAACLRVFSPSLPGQYNLEEVSPFPNGVPHMKNYPIDNVTSQEHVIFNITPNVNITLVPMTSGPNPQILGFYVVNSGDPENPVHSPDAPPGPPYTSCQNFVVLEIGGAPESPAGGEFLHGLGYLDATNLGFDDLTAAGPTGDALRDAVAAAARNYNTQVDPLNERDTFAHFKTKNGFNQDPGTLTTVAAPGVGEFTAQYANSGDLGFGRDMHCIKKANADVACYVTNYGTGYNNLAPGGGTDDHDDANAAGQRATVVNPVTGNSAEVATVAMEYSAIENDPLGAAGGKQVKFYVYKKGLPNYGRSISANLDGRGERPVPQLCMICHGGVLPAQTNGIGTFGSAADVKLSARFLPFDHRFYTFPTLPAGLSVADQEPAFKNLNVQIVNSAPPAPSTDPIQELISGMYNNGASLTQIRDFIVPGWASGVGPNAPNQAGFYTGVVANACRGCHTTQPFQQLQFNSADKFINLAGVISPAPLGANNHLMLGTAQLRVCSDYVMPHALRTHDIFWNPGAWDVASWGPPPIPYYSQFQTFGDGVGGPTWKTGLCTSFISSLASSPSQFYENTIQPIWSGKCVACHVTGGPAPFSLVDGVSYALLVPGRVVPNNDNPSAAGNALLYRLALTDSRDALFSPASPARMPQNCAVPPAVPAAGQLPCLEQLDIDKIKAWVRNGAN